MKPMTLEEKYHALRVNRTGDTPQAFMQTTRIVGEVKPDTTYQIVGQTLKPSHKPLHTPPPHTQIPPHTCLQGQWINPIHTDPHPSNILGDIGSFLATTNNTLTIPVAPTTPAHLAYYGAQHIYPHTSFQFETNTPLPLFQMTIGSDYITRYMLQQKHAGGIYIEYHDKPHFHMPLQPHAHGHLILGKKITPHLYHLSAFAIPYTTAIYTPPGTIHNDSFLVGSYLVAYTTTPHFSTVRLLTASKHILPVSIPDTSPSLSSIPS